MNTHDVLAFSIASEIVQQIRQSNQNWSSIFSPDVFATSSRTWPIPDFVIVDNQNEIGIAGEFKPPNQSKREYLTGLGQTMAYTRDFHYALLVVPEVSDDDYRIAEHIQDVIAQDVAAPLPIGLLSYDPRTLSAARAEFELLYALQPRTGNFSQPITNVGDSFWAKWRDISPHETGLFLDYLYLEGRQQITASPQIGAIRDRAFDRLWNDMTTGRTQHWGGRSRSISNTQKNKIAWFKNYRNFISHIGWCLADGKLTASGLDALQLAYQYETASRLFLDYLALSVLLEGKHLVLLNSLNTFQDARCQSQGLFTDEEKWLDEVEEYLENSGLLKRNPGRAAVAVQNVSREFLKAEKTLWKNLNLIIPSGPQGGRVYHRGRGLIFNWSYITALLGTNQLRQ